MVKDMLFHIHDVGGDLIVRQTDGNAPNSSANSSHTPSGPWMPSPTPGPDSSSPFNLQHPLPAASPSPSSSMAQVIFFDSTHS